MYFHSSHHSCAHHYAYYLLYLTHIAALACLDSCDTICPTTDPCRSLQIKPKHQQQQQQQQLLLKRPWQIPSSIAVQILPSEAPWCCSARRTARPPARTDACGKMPAERAAAAYASAYELPTVHGLRGNPPSANQLDSVAAAAVALRAIAART